jgi:hypothetical protein
MAVLAIAICLQVSLPRVYAVSSEDATAAVASAGSALQAAFVTVSDAERAGANVSSLIARLNQAGSALTSARVALDAGNYSGAAGSAALSEGLADAVAADATVSKDDAVTQASYWWETVLLSFVGSASLLAVLFLLWQRFKRLYRDRVLGGRPEVVE